MRYYSLFAKAMFVAMFVAMVVLSYNEGVQAYLKEFLGSNVAITALVYVCMLIVTTVFAPFVGLPLAPVTSIIIGPFLTVVYSIVGWTVGAVIAFLIARHVARPLLSRFVDLKQVSRYDAYIPRTHIFFWLVFLRIIIPVDILSYAIGLSSSVSLPMYVTSTVIGVIPFSYIWVYGGYALIERNYAMFAFFGVVGLLLFGVLVAFYYSRRHNR